MCPIHLNLTKHARRITGRTMQIKSEMKMVKKKKCLLYGLWFEIHVVLGKTFSSYH